MAKEKIIVIEADNFIPVITNPKLYEVTIKGLDSLLMNKMPDLSKAKKEKDQSKKDSLSKEESSWREKIYFNENEEVYIPGENIHECMKEAAKYWGKTIPGEGKKTYTDVILKAVIVEDMLLGFKKDDERLIPFGKNVNGQPGKGKKSGSKVYKIRPLLRPWGGTFRMHVFDDRLTNDILKIIFAYSGIFIGLCDWRPTFGRFELQELRRI